MSAIARELLHVATPEAADLLQAVVDGFSIATSDDQAALLNDLGRALLDDDPSELDLRTRAIAAQLDEHGRSLVALLSDSMPEAL